LADRDKERGDILDIFSALSLSSDPPQHSSEVATENKKFVLSTNNRNAEAGVKDEKSQKEPSEMCRD
jgi:hypothetical protein